MVQSPQWSWSSAALDGTGVTYRSSAAIDGAGATAGAAWRPCDVLVDTRGPSWSSAVLDGASAAVVTVQFRIGRRKGAASAVQRRARVCKRRAMAAKRCIGWRSCRIGRSKVSLWTVQLPHWCVAVKCRVGWCNWQLLCGFQR